MFERQDFRHGFDEPGMVDGGDDLLEAIYEATLADADECAEHIGREWGEEMAGEPGALDEMETDEDQHVNDLKNCDFTMLRDTLDANGYTVDTDADEDDLASDDDKTIYWRGWQRLIRLCCEAAHEQMIDARGERAEDDAT